MPNPAADRVTYNDPDNWLGPDYAIGMVDEIVVRDAFAHLEMLGESSAYLHVRGPHVDVFTRVHARPTTRQERREILAKNGDRLRDHLRAVLPNRRTMWSVPVWRRPWSAVMTWWELRRQARAVLCIVDDEADL